MEECPRGLGAGSTKRPRKRFDDRSEDDARDWWRVETHAYAFGFNVVKGENKKVLRVERKNGCNLQVRLATIY